MKESIWKICRIAVNTAGVLLIFLQASILLTLTVCEIVKQCHTTHSIKQQTYPVDAE
jgi:hypothetical protein